MEMFETLHTDTCTICGQDSQFVGDGVTGMFGLIPVTFCQLCLDSMIAMVQDLREGEDEDMYI
jgi:hypothetical protein|tara:strand:+ start:1122 stop:1310 length:189 start_codon:yes stop_codon:yes gene_type:complete